MLKKLLVVIVSLLAMAASVQAEVDVNKADQAALDGVRGIGPSMSKRILTERDKGGSFKDWSDLQQRVKGIKEKSAQKLSSHGLTVNGKPLAGPLSKPAKGGSQVRPKGETKVAGTDAVSAPQERARK